MNKDHIGFKQYTWDGIEVACDEFHKRNGFDQRLLMINLDHMYRRPAPKPKLRWSVKMWRRIVAAYNLLRNGDDYVD